MEKKSYAEQLIDEKYELKKREELFLFRRNYEELGCDLFLNKENGNVFAYSPKYQERGYDLKQVGTDEMLIAILRELKRQSTISITIDNILPAFKEAERKRNNSI